MEYIEVDPRRILYSQCCIRPKFRDGKFVENTIRQLVNGEISPTDIETIRVCTLPNGKTHSLDNRRLYTFKEAIRRGSNYKTVIVIKTSNPRHLESLKWKMTHPPSENWSVVKVKKDCKPLYPENNVSYPPNTHGNVLHPRTQNIPNLSVNNLHSTRTPVKPNLSENRSNSIRLQDRYSLSENRLNSTRTQDRSSLSETRLNSTRTPVKPNLSENRLNSTRTQDRYSLSENRLNSTRTQDRYSLFENRLNSTTQDRYSLSENRLNSTRTPVKSNLSEDRFYTRSNLSEYRSYPISNFSEHRSYSRTQNSDDTGGCCVII